MNKIDFDSIQNWIERHRMDILGKNLYIFGAGIRGNMILTLLKESNICVAGFCDNSIEKQGAFVKDYKIFSPQEICDKPEENYILISPENSTDIEKMLEANGYIADKNYFVIKNDIYDTYRNEFFRTENVDYILFGDCYFTDLDVDNLYGKSLGEMAVEKLGEKRTKILSVHGMCIPGFYYLMKVQIDLGIIPKSVAFIVNVPFCNSIQTKLPQSQHAGLLKLIHASLPTQNDEFSQYVELAESRSHNINFNSFSTKRDTKRRDDNYVEKLLTKSRYMYEFNEDNENIVYLKKMIELLKENDIKPVPFIPAINYYTGIDYYGEDFMNKYSEICNKITDCIKKYNVDVLDMSFLLERRFYSGDRMTKFPNDEGKEKEISVLCNAIQI